MLQSAEDVHRHIEFKRGARELKDDVADRMQVALNEGAKPDYAALLEAATFLPPGGVTYHTAPRHARESIREHGLRMCAAGESPHWQPEQNAGQPDGVYVGSKPDTLGVWSHWSQWDVWAIRMDGLSWVHDRMNPGCWAITQDVSPTALELHEGRSW